MCIFSVKGKLGIGKKGPGGAKGVEYDAMGSGQDPHGSSEGYPGGLHNANMEVDSRIDPKTGKKRRGRPPKPRPDGSVHQPKRRQVDENGVPLPRGSNPIDPLTGKKKRGRPKKGESTNSQGSGNNDRSGYPGSKRESIDSNESYSGCSGDQIQQNPNQKPNADTVPAEGGTEGGRRDPEGAILAGQRDPQGANKCV